MKKKKQDNTKAFKNYAKYSSIAIQMLVIIFLGVFGGYKLDEWISWSFPVFTLLFSILSVVFAIYYVTRDLLKNDKDEI